MGFFRKKKEPVKVVEAEPEEEVEEEEEVTEEVPEIEKPKKKVGRPKKEVEEPAETPEVKPAMKKEAWVMAAELQSETGWVQFTILTNAPEEIGLVGDRIEFED